MDKQTYLKAIDAARQCFVYVQITDGRRQGTEISKAKARLLITQVPPEDDITAWLSDDQRFLLIG